MRRAFGAATLVLLTSACVGGESAEPIDRDTIEVFGPWRGTDADKFADVLAPFEATTGIDVRYVASVDFVRDLIQRTGEDNDPPDVAMVPQPGLVRQLALDGDIVPLERDVQAAIIANLGSAATFGEVDGTLYAAPFRFTVKSLVWYSPDVFRDNGWDIPATLDELETLVDMIASSGAITPWCLGINAGSATGWPATDWTEDLVLRSIGPERYQQWVTGDIEFADPDIAAAFARFQTLVLEPDRVLGGVRGVVDTPVDEAVGPLFGQEPLCALHRQADFAANWFPSGTSIGPEGDVDFFILPGLTATDAPPIVIGGDQAVQFRADDDIDQLIIYLSSADAAAIWAGRGGFLSPNPSVPSDVYPQDFMGELTAAIADETALVFDASDQMAPAIGSDLLWDHITSWVAGVDDYATFAAALDSARADDADPPASDSSS
jgi:alpha-glucoside transport system substrate-binding protein